MLRRAAAILSSFSVDNCCWVNKLLGSVPPDSLIRNLELVIRAVGQGDFELLLSLILVTVRNNYFAGRMSLKPMLRAGDHCDNRKLCLSLVYAVEDEGPNAVLDWMSNEFFLDKSFVLEALRNAGW